MSNNQEDKMIQVSMPVLDGSTNGHIPVTNIAPAHFSIYQLNKLEDIFLYQKWPDNSRISVIAMECNLTEQDVQDWFFARRVEWIRKVMELLIENKKQST